MDHGSEWQSCYDGKLLIDTDFEKFGINTGASMTTFELADLFKMNRSFFETKDVAMKLVSELTNFKAKVDKQVENMDDSRGNKRVLLAQAVNSNIPKSFNLNVPVFKGFDKEVIEVEVSINAHDLSCCLISPHANDIINETKDGLISEQLKQIESLFPNLKVFFK